MGIRNQKIVILPPFRSAALHQNANPLPVNNILAFGQDILNKQRSGDFRLFPPANFANSAILPTDKISAFFMQNFLLQKPKDSSWSMPLLSPQGKNDRLRYRSAEWTLSTPWPERFQLRWHLRMRLGNVSKLPFLSACT